MGTTEALRRRLASIDFITRLGRSSIQSRGLLLVLGYFCEFPRELRQGRLLAEDLRKPVADVRPLHVALEHVPALAYEVIDEQPPLGVRVEGPRPLLEVGLPLGERAPQVAPAVGGRRRRRGLLGGGGPVGRRARARGPGPRADSRGRLLGVRPARAGGPRERAPRAAERAADLDRPVGVVGEAVEREAHVPREVPLAPRYLLQHLAVADVHDLEQHREDDERHDHDEREHEQHAQQRREGDDLLQVEVPEHDQQQRDRGVGERPVLGDRVAEQHVERDREAHEDDGQDQQHVEHLGRHDVDRPRELRQLPRHAQELEGLDEVHEDARREEVPAVAVVLEREAQPDVLVVARRAAEVLVLVGGHVLAEGVDVAHQHLQRSDDAHDQGDDEARHAGDVGDVPADGEVGLERRVVGDVLGHAHEVPEAHQVERELQQHGRAVARRVGRLALQRALKVQQGRRVDGDGRPHLARGQELEREAGVREHVDVRVVPAHVREDGARGVVHEARAPQLAQILAREPRAHAQVFDLAARPVVHLRVRRHPPPAVAGGPVLERQVRPVRGVAQRQVARVLVRARVACEAPRRRAGAGVRRVECLQEPGSPARRAAVRPHAQLPQAHAPEREQGHGRVARAVLQRLVVAREGLPAPVAPPRVHGPRHEAGVVAILERVRHKQRLEREVDLLGAHGVLEEHVVQDLVPQQGLPHGGGLPVEVPRVARREDGREDEEEEEPVGREVGDGAAAGGLVPQRLRRGAARRRVHCGRAAHLRHRPGFGYAHVACTISSESRPSCIYSIYMDATSAYRG